MTGSRHSASQASGSTGQSAHAAAGAPMDAASAAGPAGSNVWRPSALYLAAALALAAGGLAFWLLSPPTGGDSMLVASAPVAGVQQRPASVATASSAATVSSAAATAAATPMAPASRLPEGDADPTRDLSSYVMRGEKPTMHEVIERLHKAGIREGLGAFSPPGTRPPMIGLAVPEDFVLPDGYVRHHQATDDGQRIEAILMFAPDRQILDATGKPIPVPKNRVVPPEYAPPGLPIRRITLPKPLEPEGAAR